MPERSHHPLEIPSPRHPSSTAVMSVADIQAALAAYGDELDVHFHDRETLPAPPMPEDDDGER